MTNKQQINDKMAQHLAQFGLTADQYNDLPKPPKNGLRTWRILDGQDLTGVDTNYGLGRPGTDCKHPLMVIYGLDDLDTNPKYNKFYKGTRYFSKAQ